MDAQVKKVIDKHEKQVRAATAELQALEEQAQTIRAVIEARDSAQRELTALEDERSGLLGERAKLAAPFATALFEDDREQVEGIRNRRAEIDSRVSELDQHIDKTEKRIKEHRVDGRDVADVVARAGVIESPDIAAVLEQVRIRLEEERRQLTDRTNALASSLRGAFTSEQLEKAHAEHDPKYGRGTHGFGGKELERQERQREEALKDQERYGDVKDSSTMVERMGRVRPLEDFRFFDESDREDVDLVLKR